VETLSAQIIPCLDGQTLPGDKPIMPPMVYQGSLNSYRLSEALPDACDFELKKFNEVLTRQYTAQSFSQSGRNCRKKTIEIPGKGLKSLSYSLQRSAIIYQIDKICSPSERAFFISDPIFQDPRY
jgi:hypothetical protein